MYPLGGGGGQEALNHGGKKRTVSDMYEYNSPPPTLFPPYNVSTVEHHDGAPLPTTTGLHQDHYNKKFKFDQQIFSSAHSPVPTPRPRIELPLSNVDPCDAERLRRVDLDFAQLKTPTIQQKMVYVGPHSYRISYYWMWDADMGLSVCDLVALKSKYEWVTDIRFNPSGNTCCLEINKVIGLSSPCFCDSCRVASEISLMDNNIVGSSTRKAWFKEQGEEFINNNFAPRFSIEVRKANTSEKKALEMESKMELLAATLTNPNNNNTSNVLTGGVVPTAPPYYPQ